MGVMEVPATETPACNTGGFVEKVDVRSEVVRYGVDDLTVGFDYSQAPNLALLRGKEGEESRWGRRLGSQTSFGGFANLLGRSVALFKPDTNRLYVQAKMAEEGGLQHPLTVSHGLEELMRRMAIVGIEPYGEAWVTRVDVAVDVRCAPEVGRAIIGAMGAVRLDGGRRVEVVGDPKSTVYFRPRKGRDVHARTYCRNLRTGQGEPFGLIRFEAVTRFPSRERTALAVVESPEALEGLWVSRFGRGKVRSSVTRLPREVQTMTLAEMVRAGQIGYAQMERLSTFLDLERLGLAEGTYPKSVLAARRREARSLGLSKNDAGDEGLELELDELLSPARSAWSAL